MRFGERAVCAKVNRFFLTKILACFLLIQGYAGAQELKEFTSDGCSLFPDGTMIDRSQWCDCCFNHDIAYWRGGSKVERNAADSALRKCVLERTGKKVLANAMYTGVQMGGSPIFPTWYRWGYGWLYGRGYKPLTSEEQTQVTGKFDTYKRTHPAGYCRKQ